MGASSLEKKKTASVTTAATGALLAAAIFNPWTFNLVNGIWDAIFKSTNAIAVNGRPTGLGILVHGVVFFIIQYVILYWSMAPEDRPKVCCDKQ